jgi:uncharacterized damage-inducible protein DinB
MIPISPEQALFLLKWTLPAVKNEHRTTRSVIDAIPQTNLDYRPDPYSKTAMELAWHIAASEHRFFGGIAAGAFDFSPNHRPESVKTGPQIGEWFGISFAKNVEQISALSGEQLARMIDFRGMFQMPAVAYLNMTMNHSIHHRGQLSTYLRAMGSRVPAIYGESYDSAEAKKVSQTAQA